MPVSTGYRRKAVGAVLLSVTMGFVAFVVTDLTHGLLSGALVLVALIVSDNL